MKEKLQEILNLVLRINSETERAAFFDYSGHVNCVCISIREGKEGQTKDEDGYRVDKYCIKLFEASMIKCSEENIEKEYMNIIKGLNVFLEEQKESNE